MAKLSVPVAGQSIAFIFETCHYLGFIWRERVCHLFSSVALLGTILALFVGLVYQSKDIVFRFIIEYNSLMDFGP